MAAFVYICLHHFFNDTCECFRIVFRHIGENFAVKSDILFLERADEFTV